MNNILKCAQAEVMERFKDAVEVLSMKIWNQSIPFGTSFLAHDNGKIWCCTALHNVICNKLYTKQLNTFDTNEKISTLDICAFPVTSSKDFNIATIPLYLNIPSSNTDVLFCGHFQGNGISYYTCRHGIIRYYDATQKCFLIEGECEQGMSGGPVLFKDTDGEWKAFAVISGRWVNNDEVNDNPELTDLYNHNKHLFVNPENCLFAYSIGALELNDHR